MIRALAACIALLCLVSALAWHLGGQLHDTKVQLKEKNAELIAANKRIEFERASNQITQDSGAKTETALTEIRTVTKTIVEKVPVYVPQKADGSDHISNGLARLHDEAASGVSDLSATAGKPNDADSPFTKTDLAFAIAFNYGQYHECAEKLTGLQNWATDQHELSLKESK